jgi:hypothetical protein
MSQDRAQRAETQDGEVSPRAIAAFRRDEHIPGDYSPGRHIATSILITGTIGALAFLLARRAQPIDWLFAPVFLIAANAIEWAFHKGPMHRPVTPRILYTNHTLVHHRAFLHDSMPVRHARDLGLIMMPWYTMLLLFALASPIALVGWALRGPGVVGIFYLVAAFYFVLYETTHALYHTTPELQQRHFLLRNRVFQALLAHHRHHHRIDRMSHVNFNVTFPLMDTVMGTRERERATVTVPAPAAE